MTRRGILPALALLALLGPFAAAAADGGLGALLGRLGAPAEPVAVSAWIERGGAHPEVVVSLRPQGEARLVADPGIVVEPLGVPAVAWLRAWPVELASPGEDYLDAPAVIRLPFAAEQGYPIRLRVDYAYCLTDLVCLFGESLLTVPTRAP
jgi:hypothetical protein